MQNYRQKVAGPALYKTTSSRSGFTLIELLVVIAIIGMLSTIAVVALNSARTKGKDAKRIADVRQMQTALALYGNDQSGDYPTAAAETALGTGTWTALCQDTDAAAGNQSGFGASCVAGATTYMGLIPRDPGVTAAAPAAPCVGAPASTAVCDYSYKHGASASQYELRFWLESGAGTLTTAGLYCATENGLAATCIH